jgi:FixJ family two-component response regulator
MSHDASRRGEIFVVDDDAETRATFSIALKAEGYDVIFFADGVALLSLARTRIPVCVFLDIRIPNKIGLDILKTLREENYPAPILMMSGQASISMAVCAMRRGATDFIEKPVASSDIVSRVNAVLSKLSLQGRNDSLKTGLLHFPGQAPLTRREQEVLERLATGASSKEIARQLGLSSRTVESHRSNIMKKLGVRNAAELVRCVLSDS